MKKEMHDPIQGLFPSLHTHRVAVIQHLQGIGLSLDQARKTWLSFAQSECSLMAEYWSIQPIPDTSETLKWINDSVSRQSTKAGGDTQPRKKPGS